MFHNTGKIRPKSFLQCESLPFFSENCLFNNLLGPKKRSYKFQSNCLKNLLTLINCCLNFVMLNITRKTGQIVSFHWKDCLFCSKNCDFNDFLGPRKCSHKKSIGKKSLWSLVDCSLRFGTLDKRGKMGQKLLSLWKRLFFWDVCFYRPPISLKNGLFICTNDAKPPCGTL